MTSLGKKTLIKFSHTISFWFKRISIRARLQGAVIVYSLVLMGISAGFLLWFSHGYFLNKLQRELTMLADVIAFNSGAVVTFNDSNSAEKILTSLTKNPAIQQAIIYKDEQVFAAFSNADLPLIKLSNPRLQSKIWLQEDLYHVVVPIKVGDNLVAKLQLSSNLDEWQLLLSQLIKLLFCLLMITLISVLVISFWLKNNITKPIERIASWARKTTQLKSFNEKVQKVNDDEIGQLIDCLNEMCAELSEKQAILELNQRLQNEIMFRQKVENSLTEKSRKLEQINSEMQEFVYAASHDLREPLRTILGYSQFLIKDLGKDLPENAAKDLRFIVNAGERMDSLTNDLLELSRVSSNPLKISKVSLEDLLESVIDDMAISINESQALIEWEVLPRIEIDPSKISQVLQNLIQNAIKYRREDISPIILIKAIEQKNDWRICVVDNGIGIDKEYHQRVFGVFKRLHGTSQYSGSGVGLALVKKIILRHQGKIWVESNEINGCTFIFEIPKNLIQKRQEKINA